MEIRVNSYPQQGVKKLAQRFKPMAFAPDGLVEWFYDPDAYNPEEGKFIMGLLFQPERMRKLNSDEFTYPGCTGAFKEFVKAVVAYQTMVISITKAPKSLKLDKEMELKRKVIVCSFTLARDIYERCNNIRQLNASDLHPGAEFFESNIAFNLHKENRLRQIGSKVKNATLDMERSVSNGEREKSARAMMEKMTIEQLSNLDLFYGMRGRICSEMLEKKQLQNVQVDHP